MTPARPQDDRPQNIKWMLWYCRKYIPGFAEMHDRAKASKLVAAKAGKK